MELGKPIALGRTAEIYAWENNQILKLFYDWMPADAADYEAQVAQAVYASGLPVPKPGDLITIEGRRGLVYERIDGLTMLGAFQKQPLKLAFYARQFAELHAEMHQIKTQQPPSQRPRLQEKIQHAKPLSEALKAAALQALAALPDGNCLCHGDFHPDNIIMQVNKRPMIIDWIDVTIGHPLADFARTAILIRFGAPPPLNPLGVLLRWGRNSFYNAYKKRYFELSKERPADVQAWLPVIAAARLSEEIASEESTLLAIVQKAFPQSGGNS